MLIGYGAIIPLDWIKKSKRVKANQFKSYLLCLGGILFCIGYTYNLEWTVLKVIKVFLYVGLSGWILLLSKISSSKKQLSSPSLFCSSGLLKGLTCLYFLHGASPYLGLEMQHSAAMLSNLRVDHPCENHLFIPTLKPLPYLYIHQAQFAHHPQIKAKRVKVLKEGIWNLTALHQMQKNWCVSHLQPIKLTVSFDPNPTQSTLYSIENLCSLNSLDLLQDAHGWGGSIWLGGWQRLQKNMRRHCLQSCIHWAILLYF